MCIILGNWIITTVLPTQYFHSFHFLTQVNIITHITTIRFVAWRVTELQSVWLVVIGLMKPFKILVHAVMITVNYVTVVVNTRPSLLSMDRLWVQRNTIGKTDFGKRKQHRIPVEGPRLEMYLKTISNYSFFRYISCLIKNVFYSYLL